MQKEIIIITDINGIFDSEWMDHYVLPLEQDHSVKVYNSHELGLIDTTDTSEKAIHEQFLNGGIDRAVHSLTERVSSAFLVLGFSIGGLIGWKAALKNLKTEHLMALSSTRLRYEEERPDGRMQLFFGESDAFQPDQHWFDKMQVQYEIIPNQGHEVYKNIDWIPYFVRQIKRIT